MKKYYTTVITKIDEELISQWKSLWNRSENATVFNSYQWFKTSLELQKNKKYQIYATYQNDKLVAILPLEPCSEFGIKALGSILKKTHVDTPFLLESYDKELFKHFFSKIFDKKNILLQKVDDKSSLILKELFPDLLLSTMSINPMVDISGDPFATTHHSTIKQLKKIIRQNEDSFRFVMYRDNFDKHIKEVFDLQEESSKKARSMDIFSNKEIKDFYLTTIKNSKDLVSICFLYFNEVPIAYQYGYIYRGIFAADQIAYRNEYGKLRPGKMMLYFLINHLKKDNFSSLDLGGGISTYKTEFTDNYRLLYNIYYSKNTFITYWWKLINKTRRIKQILLPKKHTRDHEFLFKTL